MSANHSINWRSKMNLWKKRTREQMIASQFEGKNVWNVHQVTNGMTLQKNEEPRILIGNLDEVLGKMDDGDKVFFHEGKYILPSEDVFASKDIQVEGIGECEFTPFDDDPYEVDFENKVSIKNVTLSETEFSVKQKGSLYLSDCKFRTWSTVNVTVGGKLGCHRCRFKGARDSETIAAICACGACSLSVENCLFESCGGCDGDPCVSIDDAKQMNLKLIGNTFINVYNALPIGK